MTADSKAHFSEQGQAAKAHFSEQGQVAATQAQPATYTQPATCLHFALGSFGFGSEVNNLISAVVYCRAAGIPCVVDDYEWNSGSWDDYFLASSLVTTACPYAARGLCARCEVRRMTDDVASGQTLATQGWFIVRKHAKNVSFSEKSAFARSIWQYTPWAANEIRVMNQRLGIQRPDSFVAVHIRRGDKVSGNTKECDAVPIASYTSAVSKIAALLHGPLEVVVCTDDLEAAEALEAQLRETAQPVIVRYRRRARQGHQQSDFNGKAGAERRALTIEFLADIEVMRRAFVLVCTFSSNIGRLAALLRDGPSVSLDCAWSNI